MAAGPHRKKVTLALDNVSVTDALYTMFDQGLRAKFIEFPSAVYSMHPFDRVTVDGKLVGLSTWIGYSANEGKMLTLAMLDERYAAPGTEVVLRVGRAGWRHHQTCGRAPQAGADQGRGIPRAVFERGAHCLRRQLAQSIRLR